MTEDSEMVRYISDLDDVKALEAVKARVSRGIDANLILTEAREGLDDVGRRFETGEYFLADLMYAAELFDQIMEVLAPELQKGLKAESIGRVLLATVKNDIHDIGKNLVGTILRAGGFEVVDLGVDVSPEAIYRATRESKPDIVALSCLLTNGLDSMEETIKGFASAGLRDRVKIIVGGIPLSAELAAQFGADAYGENASQGLTRCRELLGERVS